MTFLSHSAGRRAGASANRRLRSQILKDVVAAATFLLAVGFAAAFVFGFLGH